MSKLTKQVALAIAVLTAIVPAGVAAAAAEPHGPDGPRVQSAALSVPSHARQALRKRLNEILAQAKAAAPYSPSVFAHVDAYTNRFSWSGAVGKTYFGGEPVSPAVAWDAQSEGKTVTATAIWRLIEQGRLKLTDTLDKFLEPELVNQIDVLKGTNYGPKVTLRQLLTHTSGIVDWYDNYPKANEYIYGPDPKQCVAPGDTPARTCAEYRWNPRDLLALAYGLDPYFAPGESWHYSESGYFLLGLILEKLTGQSAARAQRRLVLSRANVPHMWFMSYEAPRAALAHAYDEYRPGDENGYDPVDSMSQASDGTYSYTGGGYAAPGTEWNQFFRDLVEGKIIQPRTVRRMSATTPQSRKVSRKDGKDWAGVGAGLFEYPLEGDTFYGHAGYWCSMTVYSPRLKLAVSVDFNAVNCGLGLGESEVPARDQLVRRLVQAVKAAG
jgi:D-alanyl-D-alanine carboxypeptidase